MVTGSSLSGHKSLPSKFSSENLRAQFPEFYWELVIFNQPIQAAPVFKGATFVDDKDNARFFASHHAVVQRLPNGFGPFVGKLNLYGVGVGEAVNAPAVFKAVFGFAAHA